MRGMRGMRVRGRGSVEDGGCTIQEETLSAGVLKKRFSFWYVVAFCLSGFGQLKTDGVDGDGLDASVK